MANVPARIRELLWSRDTLVIATTRDQQPWIASVFYAPEDVDDGLQLVCGLLASSRKLANLRLNPRAAVYIGPSEPTRWVQAWGAAAILDEPAAAKDALARLVAHAPAAAVFVERVPVVPIVLRLDGVKLTDLTGGKPPVETWGEAGNG